MSQDIQVTVKNRERAELFNKVFGTDTVCVVSHIQTRANLPELGEQNVYMLDLNEITREQRERLKEELAQRFCLLEDEVDEKLNAHGVPILASDCVLCVSGAGLGLLLDDDLGDAPPDDWDDDDDDWVCDDDEEYPDEYDDDWAENEY